MKSQPVRYVVWDGETERDYEDDPSMHDCMVAADEELVSVQKRRAEVLQKGIVPTIIFACKRGQKAEERAINGKMRGVFSYCWTRLLASNPDVTFRDGVRLVNEVMKQKGLYQQSEIVCRSDILDMQVSACNIGDAAHVTMFLDMCRTESKKGKRKIH